MGQSSASFVYSLGEGEAILVGSNFLLPAQEQAAPIFLSNYFSMTETVQLFKLYNDYLLFYWDRMELMKRLHINSVC